MLDILDQGSKKTIQKKTFKVCYPEKYVSRRASQTRNFPKKHDVTQSITDLDKNGIFFSKTQTAAGIGPNHLALTNYQISYNKEQEHPKFFQKLKKSSLASCLKSNLDNSDGPKQSRPMQNIFYNEMNNSDVDIDSASDETQAIINNLRIQKQIFRMNQERESNQDYNNLQQKLSTKKTSFKDSVINHDNPFLNQQSSFGQMFVPVKHSEGPQILEDMIPPKTQDPKYFPVY